MIGFAVSLAEFAAAVQGYVEPAAKIGSAAATVTTVALSAMQYLIAKAQLAQAQALAKPSPSDPASPSETDPASEAPTSLVIRPSRAEVTRFGSYRAGGGLGGYGSGGHGSGGMLGGYGSGGGDGWDTYVRHSESSSYAYFDDLPSLGSSGAWDPPPELFRAHYFALFVASLITLSTPLAQQLPIVYGSLAAVSLLALVFARGAKLMLIAVIVAFVFGGPPVWTVVQLGLGCAVAAATWLTIRMAETWLWRFGIAAVGMAAVAWIL